MSVAQPATRSSRDHHADDVINGVLTLLISDVLTLRVEHKLKLLARGFTQTEISRRNFVSAPATQAERERAADALAPYLESFGGGVPGFYRERGRWRKVWRPPGFFTPVRDERGHVRALSQRVDQPAGGNKYLWLSSSDRDGGASSGAPPHFAGRHLLHDAEELTITEGSLKAEVASYLSNLPFVGVAGTRSIRGLAARLKVNLPSLRLVLVAYDRDMMEKPQVLEATLDLCAQLESEGFAVKVRTWPGPGKGIDDHLLAQLSPREVAA